MSRFNLAAAGLLLASSVTAWAPAMADKAPTLDLKQVYDAIDCKQWTLNTDGTWSGGPKARVGTMTFSNTVNNTMSGYVDNGVDAETVLIKKCGKR